jgi:predicted nucleic acid-binding Zn ribbon protein
MAKHPQPIANVLAELLARRGYAQVQNVERLARAWAAAAGTLAARTRAGQVRRGVLEVWCSSSTLVQELGFQKLTILEKLAESAPDEKIRDLRFKVGAIR